VIFGFCLVTKVSFVMSFDQNEKMQLSTCHMQSKSVVRVGVIVKASFFGDRAILRNCPYFLFA